VIKKVFLVHSKLSKFVEEVSSSGVPVLEKRHREIILVKANFEK
jgi:hypothetical protein